jgi:hypothetical protein
MGATESACDIPAAMEAASMVLSNEESAGTLKELLLASAFRAGSLGAMPPLPRMGNDGAEVSIAATNPPAAQGANLQVTGVEAERLAGTGPDAPASLRITVRRDRGDGPLKTTVRVAGPTMTAPVERVLELGAGERERSTSVTITERPADPASTLRRAVVVSISPDSQPVDDARLPGLRLPTQPVRFGGAAPNLAGRAPALGEHTHDVLATLLACSADRLAELQALGVFGHPTPEKESE